MTGNYIELFQSDLLPQEFLEKYVGKQPKWGWSFLGYLTYKRTYARQLPDGSTEEWWMTIARCINGAQKIGAKYTTEEAQRLFDYIFNLKGSFSGRALWQLGTKTLEKFGGNSSCNCFFVSISCLESFYFLFENLMLGGGVGFSVRKEDVYELPKVKKGVQITHEVTKDADFIVPDSREGWVKLLKHTLESFFITGKSFTYSTILVRGYGEPIKTFGGTASGPGILITGFQKITKILQNREGKKIRSIDALDICNVLSEIVVAGNSRRSATIALGDADDTLFLRAKRWDLGNIPNYRAMSNNTIYADSFDYISNEVWKGYEGNGEPYGFFNLPLSQKYGRLGEEKKDNCSGLNPCGEVTLETATGINRGSGESCNLSEIFLNKIESKEELLDLSKLLYKTQKAICTLPYLHEGTTQIIHKNMRLGLSVTGVCQVIHQLDIEQWLDETYRDLRKFDKKWSKENGWPESIKLTCCKPSGTLSLLAGATPGVHPAYSQYYIRRIRIASNSELIPICRELGYHIEFVKQFDGTEDHNTSIVEFPCECRDAIVAEEMTAIQQLELVKKMQTIWSDNAVSCTVYFRKEELPDIKKWMKENYDNSIKSVSFLLHTGHQFQQPPYSPITEDEYEKLIKKIKPFTGYNMKETELLDLGGCESTGTCPIR